MGYFLSLCLSAIPSPAVTPLMNVMGEEGKKNRKEINHKLVRVCSLCRERVNVCLCVSIGHTENLEAQECVSAPWRPQVSRGDVAV